MNIMSRLGLGLLLVFSCVGSVLAQVDRHAADRAAIGEAISSYVAAFNRADAAAVASYWTPSGVFQMADGEERVGREAITEAFGQYFAETKGAQLSVETTSLRFLAPSVAAEEGRARVTADGDESLTSYRAVYVKQGDKWLMDMVNEVEEFVPLSHYEQLKPLEWMIGSWVDQDPTNRIETSCEWTENRNFITRSFTVFIDGVADLRGTQIVGWDPSTNTIRSWMFDARGTFGTGTWKQDGDRWIVRTKQVLSAGEKATAINVITKISDDEFTWQSTAREVDGELFPDMGPFAVVRQQGSGDTQ
jgi:uncharacterized protein (TIGR02246 family)